MKFIECLLLLSFGILLYAKLCTATSAGLHWAIVLSPVMYWIANVIWVAWKETYRPDW